MRTRGIPTRRKSNPAKRAASLDSRSAELVTTEVADASRPPRPKPQERNNNPVFDPKLFLARAGLGRKLLSLKKNEVAYTQGDPADQVFYVQAGRLRVTVTSASGKLATIALLGAGEFLGEDCMISGHPLRLATATAMTECALLSIRKAEMVRVLRQERQLSAVFVSFLLTRNARIQADLVDQLFNSSEKRLARVLLLLAQFGKPSKPETLIPNDQPGDIG